MNYEEIRACMDRPD